MASHLRRSPTGIYTRAPRGQWHPAAHQASGNQTHGFVTNHSAVAAARVAVLAGAGSIRLYARPPRPGRLRLPAVPGLPRAARHLRARPDPLLTASVGSRWPGMALRSSRAAGHTQASRLAAVADPVLGGRHPAALPRARSRALVRAQGRLRAARPGWPRP